MKNITDIPQDERYPFAIFKVGDGASCGGYSDSHAGTIIAVSKNGKRVTWQRDTATLNPNFKPEMAVGGFAAHCTNQNEQSYSYQPDPNGSIREFSIRKWRGRYVWTPLGGTPDGRQQISKGRYEFYDYNF